MLPLTIASLLVLSGRVAPAAEDPVGVGVGDMKEFPLEPLRGIVAVALTVANAEPLVTIVESVSADVDLRIEDDQGGLIALDHDSGVETNVHLRWVPPASGTYRLVVHHPLGSPGNFTVATLRGRFDGAPADPARARVAYWVAALESARVQGDARRAEEAQTCLARVDPVNVAIDPRWSAEREALIATARDLLDEVDAHGKARDRATAMARLQAALECLRAVPGGSADPAVAAVMHSAARPADRLGATSLGSEAWSAWLNLLESTSYREHPRRLEALRALGHYRRRLQGDSDGALAILEQVLEVRGELLSPGHPDIANTLLELGITRGERRDFAQARVLFERGLAIREARFGSDDAEVLKFRASLAITLAQLGDMAGALVLQDRALEAERRTLSEDDPALLNSMRNKALMLKSLGRHSEARTLEETILAVREKTLGPEHHDVLMTRVGLATTLWRLGEKDTGRAMARDVVAALEKQLPPDDIDVVLPRGNLAVILEEDGDVAAAREIQESVLESLVKRFPEDIPDVLQARRSACASAARLGDRARAGVLLVEVERSVRRRIAQAALMSQREAHEAIGRIESDVALLLSLAPEDDRGLQRSLFEIVETRRAIASGAWLSGNRVAQDEELGELRAALDLARRTSAGMAGALRAGGPRAPTPEAIAAAARRRDEAESALRTALRERGAAPAQIGTDELARRLPERSAAVGFVRFGRRDVPTGKSSDAFLAFVLHPGGTLARVDLGPAREIESAIRTWRAAIGRPAAAASRPGESQELLATSDLTRGIGATTPADPDAIAAAAAELGRRILAPVLDAAGPASTLSVCLDDVLHLVPFDALPDRAQPPESARLLGERCAWTLQTSFAELMSPASIPDGTPLPVASGPVASGLVALGDIAYGDSPAAPDGDRSGALSFPALPGAAAEVAGVADLFDSEARIPVRVLTRGLARKSGLAALAPTARFLHVATHGYYAIPPARVRAESPDPAPLIEADEALAGMLPMSLCGLALAGANEGPGELGDVPGILTAEELAGLDLRGCELAVLSACDTNAGPLRAGRGIQSLQAALHAAGARSSLTSLWRVEDAAALELMREFYSRLLAGKLSRARALWEAKLALRARGAPIAHWAGWTLTGETGPIAWPAPGEREGAREK